MNSLLSIGEINLTTRDIEGIGQQLINRNIPIRDGESLNPDGLTFMGSDGAFLLLGKPGRRWIFSEQYAEIHPLMIEVDFKHASSKMVQAKRGFLKHNERTDSIVESVPLFHDFKFLDGPILPNSPYRLFPLRKRVRFHGCPDYSGGCPPSRTGGHPVRSCCLTLPQA